MEHVSNSLFWISNGLLVPVMAGLLFFFLKSILLAGGFVGQYLQHAKRDKQLQRRMKAFTADTLAPFTGELKEQAASLFTETARQLLDAPGEAARNRTLSEYEITADTELGQYKLLVKFGPILGLMGTLIPMGPALAGLSSGDISSMAYNMQVAFATTVLGLFVGAVGFVLLQVKQRWFTTDLVYLDYLSALADEKSKTARRASSLLTAKIIAG